MDQAALIPNPWRLADPIADALVKTRFAPLRHDERWWRSQFRLNNVNGGIDFVREILRADAWCATNPGRAPRKDPRRFLNAWFQRAGDHE